MPMTPEDVFGVGYYYYQWLRTSHPEMLERIREEAGTMEIPPVIYPLEEAVPQPLGDTMPREWWLRWGRGLMNRVYPVLAVIMLPEYLDFWVEGLRERLAAHGVTLEEVMESL